MVNCGAEQTKAKHNPLSAGICDLEVAAATSNREKGVFMPAVRSLNGLVAAGKDAVNTAEARGGWTSEKML